MHALNLGNDGEDGQPDELQLRENVIAVAATQSSILPTVWLWDWRLQSRAGQSECERHNELHHRL